MKIANVDDLVAVLNDGASAPLSHICRHLNSYRSQRVRCDTDRLDRWGLDEPHRNISRKARELVEGGLGDRFRLGNNRDPEMAALRERYGYLPGIHIGGGSSRHSLSGAQIQHVPMCDHPGRQALGHPCR